MARHYSTKNFFRQVPNALLARYFGARGVLAGVDFCDAKTDELFAAWLCLPDQQRNEMDAELREIFEMGCEKGFRAILDEASFQLANAPNARVAFVEKLSALANHSERAMVSFLDYREFWLGATRFYHADMLPYWRKRKNFPHVPAAVDQASIEGLAQAIIGYFFPAEARARHCVVEAYRRGERDYFFAYPEDYSQQEPEWVDGKMGRRPHNPAFEVVFVYSQKDGSLDLNFRGTYKAIEPLQARFATTILKLPELPPDPRDDRVYDLTPFRRRDFELTYDPGSGIERVVVTKLRLSSRHKKGDRITLEADTSENPKAVYDLLEQIVKATPLHRYYVTQVGLSASVVVAADKPPKKIAFSITYPCSCSLKYDGVDLKLRAMLEASGVEPKEPTDEIESDAAVELIAS